MMLITRHNFILYLSHFVLVSIYEDAVFEVEMCFLEDLDRREFSRERRPVAENATEVR